MVIGIALRRKAAVDNALSGIADLQLRGRIAEPIAMEKTQVVIIGGGATGAGILWDLSLRGIPAVLLEKKDLANGATGRCHGLLHSGGRYVVKDAEAAKECISENMILKKVAARLRARYWRDVRAYSRR